MKKQNVLAALLGGLLLFVSCASEIPQEGSCVNITAEEAKMQRRRLSLSDIRT